MLRALQENKVSHVGSDKDIQVDVRVVAATNKDLKAAVAAENSVRTCTTVWLWCPSMFATRPERASDIPLLVTHFLDVLCVRNLAALCPR